MALPNVKRAAPKGHAKPRIAPPIPARSLVKEYRQQASDIGITLMPGQVEAGRYLTALGSGGGWLYREIADIESRQNGKTKKLVPLIVMRLRAGRRIMHTAQNRELPREVFGEVAEVMGDQYAKEVRRTSRGLAIRFANGQEEIEMRNGGRYRIVAPTRGGARGPSNDDVIVDELREMDTWDFIAAAKPTLTASKNPQIVYLSNAGETDSIVLNAIRDRRDSDPSLAYLEWSASPERAADDLAAWAEANPSMGNEAEGMGSIRAYLEAEYRTAKLEGTLAIFETEHLCRWVNSTREVLVNAGAWQLCEAETLEAPSRPVMAVSMDPSGTRASAAIAWQQADDKVALRLLFDVPGDPIDTDRLGKDLRDKARELGVKVVGFDPLTDAQLARFFPKAEPVAGQKYANASARFVSSVEAGKIRWGDCSAVGDDLTWTARKPHDESGSFQAVRANDDRPITAALAAIRAVWLASSPESSNKPYAVRA